MVLIFLCVASIVPCGFYFHLDMHPFVRMLLHPVDYFFLFEELVLAWLLHLVNVRVSVNYNEEHLVGTWKGVLKLHVCRQGEKASSSIIN